MADRYSPSVKIEHARKFIAIVDRLNRDRFDESAALLRQHRVAMGDMAGAMNSQMHQTQLEPSLGAHSTNVAAATNSGEMPELPPEDLRWRVSDHRSAKLFWDTGAGTVANVEEMLAIAGKSIAHHSRALDFGCGCGRVLLHMRDLARDVELHGSDIDPESIAWCQAHIPWAMCVVNPWRPPLPYPDGHFDLIFNQSVFTHLDEDYQDVWLQELMRVTRPGAAVVLSVSGEGPFAEFVKLWSAAAPEAAARYVESFRSTGFVYVPSDGWDNGPFPDFYHSAFHAPWYIFRHWGRYFDIKAHVPGGSLGYLDYVLLIRRDGPPVPTPYFHWETAHVDGPQLAARSVDLDTPESTVQSKAAGSIPARAYRKLKRLAASMRRQK